MLKHNLCANVSADILYGWRKFIQIMKRHVATGLGIIGEISIIFTSFAEWLVSPSYCSFYDMVFEYHVINAPVSTSFLGNLFIWNSIVLGVFILYGLVFILALLLRILFNHLQIGFKRYKVNVRDAYVQKKLRNNN